MNTIRKYPEVGDIALLIDGKIRFVGQDATPEWVETQQAIGVVYFVNGNHVKVVGGQNDLTLPWSCVADYEIESIPEETGEYAVLVYNNDMGNFTYTRTEGTKEEFVSQLNAWLAVNAPICEAYMYNGAAVFQITDYNKYESNVSIAGCRLRKRMGEELAAITTDRIFTQAKTQNFYLGLCRARMEEYVRPNTSSICNPAERIDGVTKLFGSYPCSEAYYNGELGDGLRGNYPTYDDYLDACMARPWELDKGVMAHRDGKAICALLKDKKVLVRGEEKSAYTAVEWALNYDSGVPGFGKGDWWLPSMHEMALLMRDITYNTKKPLDKITLSLRKKTGWTAVAPTSYRWSCSRLNVHYAWLCDHYGVADSNNFCYGFVVSAVSAFNLDFNA